MKKDYFYRVNAQSPTRLWINNPTEEEARRSIEAGAIACTTNPTYCMKMHQKPAESRRLERDVAEAAAGRIASVFLPLFERSGGRDGFVSIQGSPHLEHDPDWIVRDARENRSLSPNIIVKIPTTRAGLEAMRVLMAENVPIIATEIMAVAQAASVCALYREAAELRGVRPPLYVTHISGIFDDWLRMEAERTGAPVPRDLLFQAGCTLARRQYRLMKERNWPGTLLGGGARGVHHFTEMVGGHTHVTINLKGTADTLIETDPPVIWRMETPIPEYLVKGLSDALPGFRKAWDEDGLRPEEYAEFGPVVLFRDMFIEGWDYLLDLIRRRRSGHAG